VFHYLLLVPKDYDSQRRYPLRFYLHGGVNRPPPERRDGSWWHGAQQPAEEDFLSVIPLAWNEAKWWQENQAENLPAILQQVRRSYNVDENRTTMLGISDGGTGAFFYAFTAPTPWAAFVPLIGHARVLASPTLKVKSQLYTSNLANRAFYAVNGGKDPLYPTSVVEPMLQHFATAGAEIIFRPKPDAGHDLSWMQEEKPAIDSFLEQHPRDPLPDRLSWETDDPELRGRYHWLQITELGPVPGESKLQDPDISEAEPNRDRRVLFPRERPSGRVDLERMGSRIAVQTRGVRRFKLLLAPRQFDLDQPIQVTVNGQEVFVGMVERKISTLLHWASIDQDRSQLYAAELNIDVAAVNEVPAADGLDRAKGSGSPD
jgi:predicted esterase